MKWDMDARGRNKGTDGDVVFIISVLLRRAPAIPFPYRSFIDFSSVLFTTTLYIPLKYADITLNPL